MSTPQEEPETPRDSQTVLRLQIRAGLGELRRPAVSQFLSAVSCGLTLAIGIFALFVMASEAGGVFNPFVTQLFKSVVYTFGFVFAISSRTELFTEHTSLALLPVLSGYGSWTALGRLWLLIWSGNLLGSGVFAIIIVAAGRWLHLVEQQTFITIARTFISLSPRGVVIGAIIAGWLMALLAWMLASVKDTISRVVIIMLTTFLIGFGHLPHCVAANTEVIAGIVAGAEITWGQWARFQALTTLGNLVGGAVFVGLLNYAFARRGRGEVEESIELR